MSDGPQVPRRMVFRGALSVAALASLAACTGSPNNSQSASATFNSGWGDPNQPTVAPLTGLPSTSSTVTGPALAVKMPNDSYGARPQININRADQMYEELVEGGITRYVGIFHSDIPDVVGPVRSFRPMDPAIMHPYNPLVVYSGGQQPFIDMLNATGLTSFDESSGAQYFSRLRSSKAPEKTAPDNLILAAADLVAAHSTAPAPNQIFPYSASISDSTAVASGTGASTLDITMSSSSARTWVWDAATAAWSRTQDGSADVQYDSSYQKSAVTTTNVVIVRVDVDRSAFAGMHDAPPYTHLYGSGVAFVAAGGKIVEAVWSKGEDTPSPLVLTTRGGLPIRLAPGRTWFHLVPNDGGAFTYL